MKLVLECSVECDVILSRNLEVRNGPRTFFFEINEENRWTKIRVVADVADPSKFKWGTRPVPEPRSPLRAPFAIDGIVDAKLYDSLVSHLQCLESTLSVFLPVHRLDWRYPTINVIF